MAVHAFFPVSLVAAAQAARAGLAAARKLKHHGVTTSSHGGVRMLKRRVLRFREIEGRTLTDFGLILALIAVLCAGALTLFGDGIDASFARFAANF